MVSILEVSSRIASTVVSKELCRQPLSETRSSDASFTEDLTGNVATTLIGSPTALLVSWVSPEQGITTPAEIRGRSDIKHHGDVIINLNPRPFTYQMTAPPIRCFMRSVPLFGFVSSGRSSRRSSIRARSASGECEDYMFRASHYCLKTFGEVRKGRRGDE